MTTTHNPAVPLKSFGDLLASIEFSLWLDLGYTTDELASIEEVVATVVCTKVGPAVANVEVTR